MITTVSPETTSLTVPRSHPVAIAAITLGTRLANLDTTVDKRIQEGRESKISALDANEAVESSSEPKGRFTSGTVHLHDSSKR